MDLRPTPPAPLLKLWRDGVELPIHRLKDLSREEADRLVEAGATLVLAQTGTPLLWFKPEAIAWFWKERKHAAHLATGGNTGTESGRYQASLWESLEGVPVVLLETMSGLPGSSGSN